MIAFALALLLPVMLAAEIIPETAVQDDKVMQDLDSTAVSRIIPRHILALWDSASDVLEESSLTHLYLEMPLNYLGFDLVYQDIQQSLPDIQGRHDIAAILIYLRQGSSARNPQELIDWLIAQDKKIILFGNMPFENKPISSNAQNILFEKIGFLSMQEWVDDTEGYHIISRNEAIFPFEVEYQELLPSFYKTRAKGSSSYLKVRKDNDPNTDLDLIVVGKKGAFVSETYFINRGWYFDPIRFFEKVFQLEESLHPIPDVTTLNGKRIFFATCHGDNWNTETTVEKYEKQRLSCAEVILKEILEPYPEIPTTVAIVAADLDPDWVGTEKSQQIARATFALKHIETASHTYSHPFDWQFFHYGGKDLEIQFLHLYPYGSWQNSFLAWMRALYYQTFKPNTFGTIKLKRGYVVPRAYANEPFHLQKEILTAPLYLNHFAPKEKPMRLLVWSGDSLPWDTAAQMSVQGGMKNFGGGFVRLDALYPSLIHVSPLGRKPGGVIQPYACANSDNGYTENWSSHFSSFQNVVDTWINTDRPRRLKALQLYYHTYSGQFEASIEAIKKNIEYIRTQSLSKIKTSDYVAIVEGFYSCLIDLIDARSFRVRNRKALQTIRLDHPKGNVDLERSLGVLGTQKENGSLYIALDPSVEEPLVVLQ